jgi:hypothetical protein
MDHRPVDTGHLQQISQLNELFLDLTTQQDRFGGLSARARRTLEKYTGSERQALGALPRALFQLQLSPAAAGPRPPDAIRAFNLTALLVAFNMIRDSRFAAQVLFVGSSVALAALARAQLSQLIDFSLHPDLVRCPLLEHDFSTGRFLARSTDAQASRHARIALAHAQTMVGAPPPDTLGPMGWSSRAH